MNSETNKGALLIAAAAVLAFAGSSGANALPPENASPTCSDTIGVVVHGQHVVGDYVAGTGSEDLDWPPSGGEIGATVAENGGAAIPGGPGPGFHFPNGVAPGASFCTGSQSPGAHF